MEEPQGALADEDSETHDTHYLSNPQSAIIEHPNIATKLRVDVEIMLFPLTRSLKISRTVRAELKKTVGRCWRRYYWEKY